MNTFLPSATDNQVITGMLQTFDDGSAVKLGDTVFAPTSSNGGGNNLLFRFEFDSNLDAGSYIETINSQPATQYSSYADGDAKFDNLTMYMFDGTIVPTNDAEYLTRANLVPKTNLSYGGNILIKNDNPLQVYKDNREVISMMYQLQQISLDSSNVIIGRMLSRKNRLVTTSPPTTIYLHTYTSEKFGKTDTTKALSGSTSVAITPTVDVSNKKITISHANLTSSTSSWCITDENDNILIAVNQDGTLLNVLTFDFLNKISGINYNY